MSEICTMRLDPDTRAILVKHLRNALSAASDKLLEGDYSDENLINFDELNQLVRGIILIRPEETESNDQSESQEASIEE